MRHACLRPELHYLLDPLVRTDGPEHETNLLSRYRQIQRIARSVARHWRTERNRMIAERDHGDPRIGNIEGLGQYFSGYARMYEDGSCVPHGDADISEHPRLGTSVV